MATSRSAPTAGRSAGTDGVALGAVILVHGPEDLLAERAITETITAVRSEHPDADVSEPDAASLDAARFAELTSPSLFATSRVVVIRRIDTLPTGMVDSLVAYAQRPQPDVTVVLTHPGGQKGRGTVDKLRKAQVMTVPCENVKAYELPRFVAAEVQRTGGRIAEGAAGLLVEAVGSDLRSLTGAVSQLRADLDDEPITEEAIRRYFAGRAEVSSFAVADATLGGKSAEALEQLRWALRTGVAPVLVTSALASGLRNLARLAGAPRGLRDADLAREVGAPPWKIKVLRGQLRGWTPDGLATALEAVARADAEVKGAAEDASYALERAVLTITDAHTS